MRLLNQINIVAAAYIKIVTVLSYKQTTTMYLSLLTLPAACLLVPTSALFGLGSYGYPFGGGLGSYSYGYPYYGGVGSILAVANFNGSEDYSPDPVPESAMKKLDKSKDQPVYLFTRLHSDYGTIIPPNYLFRVDKKSNKPLQPYIPVNFNSSIAQPIFRKLIEDLDMEAKPEEPYKFMYLLTEVNTTDRTPTAPFLVFHVDDNTKKPEAPYVWAKYDPKTGGAAKPEILKNLDDKNGKLIVDDLLPKMKNEEKGDQKSTVAVP